MESRHCGQDKRIFLCPVHNASTPCLLQAFGIRYIGSLGLVHNKLVNGLKVIGLATSKAKAIAKYVSVSAQIGSYLCWSSRMHK